ncbi:MAG: hypothetical protein IKY83_08710 [Proteobacteria bacterium]|nr:hypothetical protein [Pseudomonadota bacterium]
MTIIGILSSKFLRPCGGYSDSLEGAEALMRQVIESQVCDCLVCFYIREEPINRMRLDPYVDVEGEFSERVYDADGTLMDSCGASYEFNGREPELIRFKPAYSA